MSWGDCLNTYAVETDQLAIARRVGLAPFEHAGLWPVIDLAGLSVVDLSGGPCSLLLKARNPGVSIVVEPEPLPAWVHDRYATIDTRVRQAPVERFVPGRRHDEAWVFDVLRRSDEPERVLEIATGAGYHLRAFEWLDHPDGQRLEAEQLDLWAGLAGTVERIGDGTAWYCSAIVPVS